MKVAMCGPPPSGGNRSELFAELMRGQVVMYNYVTCRNTVVPDGLAELMIDSGAFQAWRYGQQIDPEKYAAWLERHDTATIKMAIDVIGGTEAQQKENLRIMESLGVDVTPVFHGPNLESWSWFFELCEKYPVVAIGSVCPDNTSSDATAWLSDVFDRVCDADGVPKHKIHGLRMASRVRDFPFASVDGSTWIRASRNGRGPTATGGQTEKPWMTCEELQRDWVRFYGWVQKCERWVPRRYRTTRVVAPGREAIGQLSFLSEETIQ